ncbi:hypothetical protein [Actinomadura formosensis]|uniref:hypothetical protein n=1 Tax=Actinomadura formosensis TaxID=60706 RepID=UPI003D8AF3EB
MTTAPPAAPDGPRAALDLGSSRIRATLPALEVIVDRPSAVDDHLRAPPGAAAPARARPAPSSTAW